ncbi:MFS transporter [Bosea sp. NPDC055332]
MSAQDQALCPSLPKTPEDHGLSATLTLLFAVAVGVIVTNLFAPQTLVGPIGANFGLPEAASGLVAMAPLLGYAAGLLLLVPLADLIENRALVLRMLLCAILAAALAAVAPGLPALLILMVVLGAACSAIQILVPIAAAMVTPARRGAVIGDVMSGLMAGILLARPLASLVTDAWGWRGFFAVSAGAMALLTLVLAGNLPRRQPEARVSYPALLASLGHLLRQEPVLRQRALSAALVMASFSLIWTVVALRLVQPPFLLGQRGIALFALVGAGGALATPLFGRLGDRGWTRPATLTSHLLLLGALALLGWAGTSGHLAMPLALAGLGLGIFLLDVGVTGDQTLGRRAVNLLQAEARARLNGLFVGIFFLGGALGSALAGPSWAWGGWLGSCGAAAVFGLLALIVGRRA